MLYLFGGGHLQVRDRLRGCNLLKDVQHLYTEKLPELTKGSVCLAMGDTSYKMLQEAGVVPKNRAIGSMREVVLPFGEGLLLVSYGPSICEIEYKYSQLMDWDFILAKRLHTTGTIAPDFGKHYVYVEDYKHLIDKLWDKTPKKPLRLSCDLETTGLSPYKADQRILSISFTDAKGKAYVMAFPVGVPTPRQRGHIEQLLTDSRVKICGANFGFDIKWLQQCWGITVTNYAFDTALAGSLLEENRSNSLELHTKAYTDIGGYDTYFNKNFSKSEMETHLKNNPDEFLKYSGGDTDACLRVAKRLSTDLSKQRKLNNFYQRLMLPASKAFIKMEHRGCLVDIERYKELADEVEQYKDQKEEQAIAMIPRRMLMKKSHYGNARLSRAALISDFMFSPQGLNLKPKETTAKTGKPSTALSHLLRFADDPEAGEFIKLLKEYNSAAKTLSTYCVGFQKHYCPDGRFHPSYVLYNSDRGGSVTGRTACNDPAIQTLPKHTLWAKPLRTVYKPPPGHVILAADYSQGEIKVTACIAEEPTMIAAYRKGMDMHSVTAASLNNLTYEEFIKKDPEWIAEARFGGKAGNFGLIYGMQPKGFVTYARDTYGVILTVEEAMEFRDKFFGNYKRLLPWHGESIAKAQKHRYIDSPLGRRRHLPLIKSWDNGTRSKAERQSINSPVQSTLTDMTQLAMAEFDRRYPDLWIWLMTHDSLCFYVPEDDYLEWAKRIKGVMENLPFKLFGWKPQLDFTVDVELSVDDYSKSTVLEL